ncbi:MAG: T9SS type A sorting domain-containing protein, partial [Bacteroidota bacterium]
HNVVVDGYNTDNYFHLNFGWGGSYNEWYLLPDEMPYGLTVIEGAIVDIIPGIPTGISQERMNGFSFTPNPANETVTITSDTRGPSVLMFFSITGNILRRLNLPGTVSSIDISGMAAGVYIISITNGPSTIRKKLVKL